MKRCNDSSNRLVCINSRCVMGFNNGDAEDEKIFRFADRILSCVKLSMEKIRKILRKLKVVEIFLVSFSFKLRFEESRKKNSHRDVTLIGEIIIL